MNILKLKPYWSDNKYLKLEVPYKQFNNNFVTEYAKKLINRLWHVTVYPIIQQKVY